MYRVKKFTAVLIALALLFAMASVAVADGAAPLINGQTKATGFVITAASSMQKPYEMSIVVTGSPAPTVTVTGTAKAYYKAGKIVVPAGLQSSSTPYTIEIVAENASGKATMSGRVDVMEVATINGYYKKSVEINLKDGYADTYAITCVVRGLPTPTTDVETEVSNVVLSNNKLYIPTGLTVADSPYTIKVSASNQIAGTTYTAETTYTVNVYADGFDETGEFTIPEIVGPEVIELEEGYLERPVFNYTVTGNPFPIVTPTGLDGVEYFDGVLTLPLGLNLKTQDYLVRLTASNDYGSDVKNIAIRIVEKVEQGDGDGDGDGGGGTGAPQTQGDGDPTPTVAPTVAPTTRPSSGGSGSSSNTVTVEGVSISARGKSGTLTMKPTEANVKEILGDFSDTEYVFDLSEQDYKEVIWKLDPRWFKGIPEDASITFKQPAGNVTITGSMMLKLIEKAPSGVVDFRFNGMLTFVVEKGSDRAKWSDPDEPIYIEIPYSGSSTENLTITSTQSGEEFPDAENVSYESGFVTGTVYNTGVYTVK